MTAPGKSIHRRLRLVVAGAEKTVAPTIGDTDPPPRKATRYTFGVLSREQRGEDDPPLVESAESADFEPDGDLAA